MEASNKIFKIKGCIQHYAWGGNTFIPKMLGVENNEAKPFAEYWLGAHPSAAAFIVDQDAGLRLNELIQHDPENALGKAVFQEFGELPYLLKILDVKDMLSIQVHPTKREAELGFEREESAGIPINASSRNYKDRNHKPEVMVALSDFWLLHGFKEKSLLEQTLSDIPEFNILLPIFKREGYRALYQFVMELSDREVNSFLFQTVKRAIRNKQEGLISKSDPDWWVAKLFEGKDQVKDIDRGVFSIYFFNIVQVNPGEAVFQGAGLPHAYLEGQNIELMANSDNVLRGGLTPKYIDVPELMKHTLFEGIQPNILKGEWVNETERIYPCPVPDFAISKIDLVDQLVYSNEASSMEILLVTAGGAVLNQSMTLKKGEAFCALPGASYQLISSGNCTIFKAFV